MSDIHFDYWAEAVGNACDELEIVLSTQQVGEFAKYMQDASENKGMAFPVPENPMIRELDDIKRELKREQEKRICSRCKGSLQHLHV